MLSPDAPGAAADWDGDGRPGLTIRKSGLKEDEDKVTRFQEWDHVAPAGGLELDGPVRLQLTSRTAKVDPDGKHVDYSIWLYSCDSSGGGCVRLAAADDVHVDDWSPAGAWEERTLQVGSVHQTIRRGGSCGSGSPSTTATCGSRSMRAHPRACSGRRPADAGPPQRWVITRTAVPTSVERICTRSAELVREPRARSPMSAWRWVAACRRGAG